MANAPMITLTCVTSDEKRIRPAVVEALRDPAKLDAVPRASIVHVCTVLREKVLADFPGQPKGYQGEAAQRIGISQPELSELLAIEKHPNKGIGTLNLIKIAKYTGRRMEDLLGFGSIVEAPGPAELTEKLERAIDRLHQLGEKQVYQEKVEAWKPAAEEARATRRRKPTQKGDTPATAGTSEHYDGGHQPHRRRRAG